MNEYIVMAKENIHDHITGLKDAEAEALELAEISGNPVNVYLLVSTFYGKGGE